MDDSSDDRWHLARFGPKNNPLGFRRLCNVITGDCDSIYMDANQAWVGQGYITVAGDSGSPLTFIHEGKPTIMALYKGRYSSPFTFLETGSTQNIQLYSPSFDSSGGGSNGAFFRKYIKDADGDGVNDAVDNCAPDQCETLATCKNPNQTDSDGDGVGDACDNCPGVFNPNQFDIEGDGRGDACDACPHHFGIGTQDSDGDKVPDHCDNCPLTPNAPPSCVTDDCIALGGICIPQTGRCSAQSDFDKDGIGNACDRCSALDDSDLRKNSNDRAEAREVPAATELGDLCDPVPQFIARPIVTGSNTASDLLGPPDPNQPANPRNTILMDATATLGRVATSAPQPNKGAAPMPASANIGFRFCNCYDLGSSGFLETSGCFVQNCSDSPLEYDQSGSNWKAVTVGSSYPNFTGQASLPKPPGVVEQRGAVFTRPGAFNGDLFFNSEFSYANSSETEKQRLGRRELIAWRWAEDLTTHNLGGQVTAHPTGFNGQLEVGGLFWSHTLFGEGGVSPRDTQYGGRLRDTYTYTRSDAAVFTGTHIAYDGGIDCIGGGNCGPHWHENHIVNVVQPVNEPFDPSLRILVPRPARLLASASGGLLAALSNTETEPVVDVTGFVSPTLLSMVKSRAYDWLSPVERPDRLVARNLSSHGVAVPKPWTQDAKIIEIVQTPEGGLALPISDDSVTCSAGTVLADCASGPRCVIPCDGKVGNSLLFDGEDPSCRLVAGSATDDEADYVCKTYSNAICPGGEVACASACFVPCDGNVGCVLNGKFGDELPDLCGMKNAGPSAAMAKAPFSEAVFAAGPTSEFVPGDRQKPLALFAATERTVFLIGGERGEASAKELWSYDLDARAWDDPLSHSKFPPLKTLAAAYDYRARKLFVLDELKVEDALGEGSDDVFGGKGKPTTKKPKKKLPKGQALFKRRAVRLVVHDLKDGASTLVGSWKRVGVFDRFAMASYDDGRLVLLLSSEKSQKTRAHLAETRKGFAWRGFRSLPGLLIEKPFLTNPGLVVPLKKHGQQRLLVLSPDNFFSKGPKLGAM